MILRNTDFEIWALLLLFIWVGTLSSAACTFISIVKCHHVLF